jgi:hypothetical protein
MAIEQVGQTAGYQLNDGFAAPRRSGQTIADRECAELRKYADEPRPDRS